MDKKIIAISVLIIIAIIAVGAYFLTTPDNGIVKVGFLAGDYDSALVVANASGMYQSQGFEVNITPYNDDRELITAMANGEVDVAYMDIRHVLTYIDKGVPVKIISSSQNGGSGIIVSNHSGINSIQDLHGKRIVTPSENSVQYMLFDNYLKQHNISIDDLNVTSHSCSSINKSIQKNKIDAAVIYEPYVSINQDNGSKILLNSDELFPDHPNCVLIASDDFISNHPDEARDIVQIHENATKYINAHKGEAINVTPIDDINNTKLRGYYFDNVSFVYGFDGNFKENVDKFMNIMIDLNLINGPISHEKLYWEGN